MTIWATPYRRMAPKPGELLNRPVKKMRLLGVKGNAQPSLTQPSVA
jgi:hypothetical protein